MKKLLIVLFTAVIEGLILWIVSLFLEWAFIEMMFLGGIAIFGVVWFFHISSYKYKNETIAYNAGLHGQSSTGIKTFKFNMSPFVLGLLLFIVVSFIISCITYYPYFIN